MIMINIQIKLSLAIEPRHVTMLLRVIRLALVLLEHL